MDPRPALDKVLDAHTHLSGSDNGESASGILKTLDGAGVDKAFVFAPLVDTRSWQLVDTDLEHVRDHNTYCAHLCASDPERLIGFAVLNPAPQLAGGDLTEAVRLMIDEARRCYHDLGLRGIKMVPAGWYPNAPELEALYAELAELGMYTVFHAGIFLDAHEGSFCRPAFYEMVHNQPKMRAQLAHLGWPWVDETLAVLAQEQMSLGPDEKKWQLRADVSFGPPDDWQLSTWEKALTTVEPERLIYGSDGFWPMSVDQYVESYLWPQMSLFEVAATTQHVAEEGSKERHALRQKIFYDNAWNHWQRAVSEPQAPVKAKRKVSTPAAARGAHQ